MIRIRFFDERTPARWQLVESKSGHPKAINLANSAAPPLYGQEAIDAANRQPRETQEKPQSAPRMPKEQGQPRKGILVKSPPKTPSIPKAVAKLPPGTPKEEITPKGAIAKGPVPHPIHAFQRHLEAANITPEQKAEYGKAIGNVLKNMPQKALDLFHQVKWKSEFYGSAKEIIGTVSQTSQLANDMALAAMYRYDSGSKNHILRLDGKSSRHTQEEIYAHEIGHLVDQYRKSGGKYSSSPEWNKAWKSENVGKYAQTSPHEGFAEFSRLVWSGEYDLDSVAKHFPQSFAFFQKNGLIPDRSTGTKNKTQEVFDTRVPMPGGNHADVKLTPPPAHTVTPAFKNWFGDWQKPHTEKKGGIVRRLVSAVVDKLTGRPKETFSVEPSKVTDESGKPKVVYHGTSHTFDTFSNKGDPKNSLSTMYGPGFYFTEDKSVATNYADQSAKKTENAPQVHPVYLNIRNPFDADAYMRNLATNKGMARLPHGMLSDILGGTDKANDYLEKLGYDGITHMGGDVTGANKHRVWIAFRPNQIKHVNNKGTFDPKNPNMYFAERL